MFTKIKTILERWDKETPRIWKEIKIIATYLIGLCGAIYVGYGELPEEIKVMIPENLVKIIGVFGLITRTLAGLQVKKEE